MQNGATHTISPPALQRTLLSSSPKGEPLYHDQMFLFAHKIFPIIPAIIQFILLSHAILGLVMVHVKSTYKTIYFQNRLVGGCL